MALFRYNATNNKLVPITSEGSVGIPVGAVMAFAEGTTHENWLLCDGRDTTGTTDELQTHYPALYTYLGNSNILPAMYDRAKAKNHLLSEFVSAAGAWTIPYDGTLFLAKGDSNVDTSTSLTTTLADGTTSTVKLFATYGYRATIEVKKGDILDLSSASAAALIRSIYTYSTEPLYIKATSAGIEVDKDLYATKGYIRDQNVLSEWEAITLPTTAATAITMDYDGYIQISANALSSGQCYARLIVNDTAIGNGNTYTADFTINEQIYVQKGDVVYLNVLRMTVNSTKARFYKLRDYTGR